MISINHQIENLSYQINSKIIVTDHHKISSNKNISSQNFTKTERKGMYIKTYNKTSLIHKQRFVNISTKNERHRINVVMCCSVYL